MCILYQYIFDAIDDHTLNLYTVKYKHSRTVAGNISIIDMLRKILLPDVPDIWTYRTIPVSKNQLLIIDSSL